MHGLRRLRPSSRWQLWQRAPARNYPFPAPIAAASPSASPAPPESVPPAPEAPEPVAPAAWWPAVLRLVD